MNEKLIPEAPAYYSPKAQKRVEMTLATMPIELSLPNNYPSQSSQMMMTSSQYRFRVEDEVRKFKYRSVMSLLLAIIVATLLATYYYLEGDTV